MFAAAATSLWSAVGGAGDASAPQAIQHVIGQTRLMLDLEEHNRRWTAAQAMTGAQVVEYAFGDVD